MNTKVKTRTWIALLNLLFLFTAINAQPVRQHLHEGWNFRQARGTNWYEATVPGTVHTDLMDNKLIDDPFYRLNERGVQYKWKIIWIFFYRRRRVMTVQKKNWWNRTLDLYGA